MDDKGGNVESWTDGGRERRGVKWNSLQLCTLNQAPARSPVPSFIFIKVVTPPPPHTHTLTSPFTNDFIMNHHGFCWRCL